jgi:dihydropyrimidinase
VVSAGRVVVEDGTLFAKAGDGRFIARSAPLPCVAERDLSPRSRFFRSLALGGQAGPQDFGPAYADATVPGDN